MNSPSSSENLLLRIRLERERRRRSGAPVHHSGAYRTFQTTYRGDPVAFVHDCLIWPKGKGPADYQDKALAALAAYLRLSLRGPHGLGKSALASWSVLWFALTRDGGDWKLPTTASVWRQLDKFLWPEIRKWARKLRWDKIGRAPFDERSELMMLSLKLATGEAFALASDKAELMEGAHADHLLYLLDESKTIPADTFDVVEGAFSNAGGNAPGEALALSISTPGEPQGRFYDIQSRKPGYEDWHVIHVTLEDAIRAGRISRDWAAQRKKQWGEDSPVYQNRVLGEFAASDEDGVIPLSWVETANERWQDWVRGGKRGMFKCVGVDVAYTGQDKTVLAPRFDNIIAELRRSSKEVTTATTGRVAGILKAHGGYAVVDVIGYGAGVVDQLREQDYPVVAFVAGGRTDKLDRSGELGFANVRSAAWWNLREMLDPENELGVGLPPDDLLTGDLTAPHWRVMSGGKIQVESKDELKPRLGRSTDDGDAVVQAFWDTGPSGDWSNVQDLGHVEEFKSRWA